MLRGLCGGRLYFVARERGLCPQASVWHAKEASVNLARWQQKTARQGEHRAGGPAALRTPCTRAHPVVGGRSILPATQYASTVRNTVAFGGPQCLRLSEFLMGSRQNFSDRFLILRSSTAFPCRVRRSRDGGPEIRALIAAAVPWLARAMAAETRLLIGHTSLCAAAAAVRTPMIAHALVLHSRHRWKGDWRCLLGRGGPHAGSVRQWCVWSSTHSPH